MHQTWEMGPCHNPLQNRYNQSSISQVHGLGWALAELGHCTPAAAEPGSSLRAGFSHPYVLGFLCKQNTCEVHPVHEAGWVKGRELPREDAESSLCGQDIPQLTGNTPSSPGEGTARSKSHPRDDSSGSHRFRTQAAPPCCLSFSAMYHAIAIKMQSFYSLHDFNYF